MSLEIYFMAGCGVVAPVCGCLALNRLNKCERLETGTLNLSVDAALAIEPAHFLL
jgi:hypothetical protein